YSLNIQRTHSERLMPALVRLLAEAGVEPKELDLIAVSIGPGSFTGLRIGVATAKGLAYALRKPLVAVGSLDALAYGASLGCGYICPLIDARRGRVYTALYRSKGWGTEPTRLTGYEVAEVAHLPAFLAGCTQPVAFTGDGALANRSALLELFGEGAQIIPSALGSPRASWVAALGEQRWERGERQDPFSLLPLYVKPPATSARKNERAGGGER
ncbi:MAG: tRNA (adenosine(37)-N6)-threonylcarbamoyltransferase complex dimerization subunit type 1 TsaB, partial [Bacillota bacterium]|nr:tRNA (adenosine(37)-N6)-threonylcarbamoyltransferase complex dimerization subunit type 1 TsaB [Bacillota bacterium]